MEFQNLNHAGKDFIIVGTGPSIVNFKIPDGMISIGCNDLGRYLDPEYLVIVNAKQEFIGDRYPFIENTNAKYVLSHLSLREIPLKEPEKLVNFTLGERNRLEIDTIGTIDYSTTSTYMAIIIAYQMGGKNIYMIGVDLDNHKLSHRLEQINQDYGNLYQKLQEKGVNLWNLSEKSLLTSIPKIKL